MAIKSVQLITAAKVPEALKKLASGAGLSIVDGQGALFGDLIVFDSKDAALAAVKKASKFRLATSQEMDRLQRRGWLVKGETVVAYDGGDSTAFSILDNKWHNGKYEKYGVPKGSWTLSNFTDEKSVG